MSSFDEIKPYGTVCGVDAKFFFQNYQFQSHVWIHMSCAEAKDIWEPSNSMMGNFTIGSFSKFVAI